MSIQPIGPIKAETWEDLIQIFGVLRPAFATDSRPSVELSLDSKGMIKPVVKVYDDDPYKAMHVAEDIFNQLRERYG